eukprot:6378866-Lingulodinium_polyedra.AAC.1
MAKSNWYVVASGNKLTGVHHSEGDVVQHVSAHVFLTLSTLVARLVSAITKYEAWLCNACPLQ